ncbi:MAG: hypothetical protein DRO09_03315 [Thermoprotei archaeon]|nr:MAG: hypothetical protein DRO09_03315 [Thermoprotei archaeon]
MDDEKLYELVIRARSYENFLSSVSSDEFHEILCEFLSKRLEEGYLKKVDEGLKKYLEKKGYKVRVVKLTEDKVPKEMLGVARQCYEQGFWLGFNVGKNIAIEVINWLIQNKLVEIDHEKDELDIKYIKVLLYFFKDKNKVNETEEAIMRILQKKELSYREIARITGRSLDTIHRHLKEEEKS